MESLGARLKREREQRKITLDEISLSTKIGTRFLLAIEEEHFDQLPGGIFNKGFVRAYARSVGVDEAQAVAEFAIALLVVAFGFAFWGFHSRERSAKPIVVPLPPAAINGSTAAPSNVPQAPPVPEIANTSPQSPASKPAAVGSQTSTPATPPPDSVPSPGAFLVQIKARADSWVAISADGRQIMQDMLTASAEKSIGARDQIVIKTGNAGALDISFNGKKLPSQGAYNEVKTITFDPKGLKL